MSGVLNPHTHFQPPSLIDERPKDAPLPPAEQRRLHNLKMKEENDRIRAEDLKNAEEEAEKERVRIEKETALKEKIERERLAFHTLRKRHEDIHQRSLLDYASTHAYEQVIIIITITIATNFIIIIIIILSLSLLAYSTTYANE